ncbi:hypothetical protein [Gracilibacillus salinarum]|uniref:Uncharacterized protein n=1 Tax=Gracilibacillus salinarum TaxID=2932255 RepID=A0ABY4GKW4_9BACI|nr:hypothetical protein [Gracilibacillus salinarum]UOQ84810.1 hypothetical protein MUN87_19490 [Gracilibacillus salinarum]
MYRLAGKEPKVGSSRPRFVSFSEKGNQRFVAIMELNQKPKEVSKDLSQQLMKATKFQVQDGVFVWKVNCLIASLP